MTGERVVRRLAAILAADVAGYSRLMGRDENGTLTRLKAHRTERLEPTLGFLFGELARSCPRGRRRVSLAARPLLRLRAL